MKYSGCKEIQKLIKPLIKMGWKYARGKKHGKLTDPLKGRILIVPISPSDYRAFLNFRRDLRSVLS